LDGVPKPAERASMLKNRPHTSDDMRPMEEIEIDHCLLDIMVVDEISGRPLGRPWLTAAVDRASEMVVGIHLSFEVPSYAALQRCLAHAFWPKDLQGLGVQNHWPCEGIPERVFVESGKEFYSTSLNSAQVALGFTAHRLQRETSVLKDILEPSPQLKQIRIMDLQEGKTFWELEARSSTSTPKTTLPELRQMLLEWIVDNYHVGHLAGTASTPLEKWTEKAAASVRRVANKDQLFVLFGSERSKTIGATGVSLYGQRYWHPDLPDLRRSHGPSYRYDIRSDPYDIGSVLLLDPGKGRWLTLESDRPSISKGVSVYQNRLRRKLAVQLAGRGNLVTEKYVEEVARSAAAQLRPNVSGSGRPTVQRVARYKEDDGKILTNELRNGIYLNAAGHEDENGTSLTPEDRVARFEAGVIDHVQFGEARTAFAALRGRSQTTWNEPSTGRAMLVVGDYGSGKSTLLKNYFDLGALQLPDGGADDDDVRPMICLEMPMRPTRKQVVAAILRSMGQPTKPEWDTQFTITRLSELFQKFRVELVMIDEAHHMLWTKSQDDQEEIIELIKSLLNHSGAQFVLFGLPSLPNIAKSHQLKRRLQPTIALVPYRWDMRSEQGEFCFVIREMENATAPLEPFGLWEPENAVRIYCATGGNIGLVSKYLSEGFRRALSRDLPTIDLALLAEIHKDFSESSILNNTGSDWNASPRIDARSASGASNPFLANDAEFTTLWEDMKRNALSAAKTFATGSQRAHSLPSQARGTLAP
jgi:hypothetical protein